MDTIKFSDRSSNTIIDAGKFKLSGSISGKPVIGSAFFECTFCSIPIPSWYWGIFHFKNGGVLSYFNPYIFNNSLLRSLWFFDGCRLHEFEKLKIKQASGEERPIFRVSGKNSSEEISFVVKTYSHATWNFKKKHPGIIGLLPNKLVYNEYPAVISEFNLKHGEKKTTLKNLGRSVGNAEHAEGLLL